MKRRIAFILTMVTVAGCMLTGCGNKGTENTSDISEVQDSVDTDENVSVSDTQVSLGIDENISVSDTQVSSEKVEDVVELEFSEEKLQVIAAAVGRAYAQEYGVRNAQYSKNTVVDYSNDACTVAIEFSDIHVVVEAEMTKFLEGGNGVRNIIEVYNSKNDEYPPIFCEDEYSYECIDVAYTYAVENGMTDSMIYDGRSLRAMDYETVYAEAADYEFGAELLKLE